MKIGIISELSLDNVNYGNRLQSFALNYYLNNKKYNTESILLKYYDEKKDTSNKLIGKIKSYLYKYKTLIFKKKLNEYFCDRLKKCNDFTKENVKLSKIKHTRKTLKNSDYDMYIVGSDVVWAQYNNGINKIRFLDIGQKKVRKVSYAASFGRDWIPIENQQEIKNRLDEFHSISVREKSTIQLLNDIGIKKVNHVCDPTMLLKRNEWKNFEVKPNKIIKDKYIFVYLLGKEENQRKKIKQFAQEKNLQIINIPHANGKISDVDNNFANINIDDCSPENWLWLINNCEYIFTDSFHGTIFATIFEKKFIVLKRENEININNRMIDYLDTINENNKFLDANEMNKINHMTWDYKKINKNINKIRDNSIDFLEKALK